MQPSGAGETLVPLGFEPVAEMLHARRPARAGETDMVRARLAKLLVNVAINPLAALYRSATAPCSNHLTASCSTPWCARHGRCCTPQA